MRMRMRTVREWLDDHALVSSCPLLLQEDAVRDRAATNKRLSAIENKIDLLLKKEGLL